MHNLQQHNFVYIHYTYILITFVWWFSKPKLGVQPGTKSGSDQIFFGSDQYFSDPDPERLFVDVFSSICVTMV